MAEWTTIETDEGWSTVDDTEDGWTTVDEPETSRSRQMAYGFESSSNDVSDLGDILTAASGIGGRFGVNDEEGFFYHSAEDQFGPDWEDASYDERRVMIKDMRQAEVEEEYSDVIEAGETDTGWSMAGGMGKMVATPTSLIPIGTSAKMANNLYKTAKVGTKGKKAIAAVESTAKLAAVNATFATESSVLRQLAAEGTIDEEAVLKEAGMAMVMAPLLLGGAKVAGAGARTLFKKTDLSVSDMSNRQARRKYREIENDMIDRQTTTSSKTKAGSDARTKEAGKGTYKKYQDIYEDREAFLKKVGANEMPMPGADTAQRVDVFDNQGPAAGNMQRMLRGMDYFAGALDTRLRNLSQRVAGRLHQTDLTILKRTKDAEVSVDRMRHSFKKLQDEDVTWEMLQRQEWDEVDTLLRSRGDAVAADAAKEVRGLLEGLGDEAVLHGIITKKGKNGRITNYFPRHIKDEEGLLAQLGSEEISEIKAALAAAKKTANRGAKATDKKARELTKYERQLVINKAVRNFGSKKTAAQKGSFKERKYKDEIPDFLRKFYHKPKDSLHLYMRDAIDEIETRKFFGRTSIEKVGSELEGPLKKGTKNRPVIKKSVVSKEQQEFVVEDSVGRYIDEQPNMTEYQKMELKSLLASRFGPGRRQSAPYISNLKSMTYGALIGNVHSAVQQFGDMGVSMWVNGVGNTTRAVFNRAGRALTRREQLIDVAADAGIARVAHDIANGGIHTQLTRVLRYSGFSKVDVMMKNISAEASLNKAWKRAATKDGTRKIYSRYAQAWGIEDASKLIDDLRNTKVHGKKPTALMKEYAANEMLEMQPIARSALPQAYLDHPDGRIAYTLLTWSLRLMDLGRRRIYNTYKSGHKKKAMIELGRAAAIMGSMETGVDYIQDWMKGRDTDINDIPARVGFNLVRMLMGPSRYAAKDSTTAPVSTLTEGFLDIGAPTISVLDSLSAPAVTAVAGVEGDRGREWGTKKHKEELGKVAMKSSRIVPVIGPLIRPGVTKLTTGKYEDVPFNERFKKEHKKSGMTHPKLKGGF